MNYQNVIFIQLVILVSAENPYRDKIKITSCENDVNKKPEMTFVIPEYLIPMTEHHTFKREGDLLQKVVGESELKMFTNDDSKFASPRKICWGFLLTNLIICDLNLPFSAIELIYEINLKSHNKLLRYGEGLSLSCKYSKSIVLNLDMESKIIREHYENENDGRLHYEAIISYDTTGPQLRTIVVLNPKHNLKLTPRYF